jgi:nucleotide-binding universal stress UspA family protein
MARHREFRILVATDGSKPAVAALDTALVFPWPEPSQAAAIVARRTPATAGRPTYVLAAFDREWKRVAASAERALAQRWPGAPVTVIDQAPVDAIVGACDKVKPDIVLLGWRGHGTFSRLLMGSVSRGVVQRIRCAALVVRRRPAKVRRFVLGVDGSPTARRAVEFLCRLTAPRGNLVTVVQALESLSLPSLALMPAGIRGTLRAEARELDATRTARARRDLDQARTRLESAGWKVRTAMRTGTPLGVLLDTTAETEADILVVGARGTGGFERLMLGSVAEGALNHSKVPVLVAR